MSHTDTAGLPKPSASLRAYEQGKGVAETDASSFTATISTSPIDPGRDDLAQGSRALRG